MISSSQHRTKCRSCLTSPTLCAFRVDRWTTSSRYLPTGTYSTSRCIWQLARLWPFIWLIDNFIYSTSTVCLQSVQLIRKWPSIVNVTFCFNRFKTVCHFFWYCRSISRAVVELEILGVTRITDSASLSSPIHSIVHYSTRIHLRLPATRRKPRPRIE